MNLNQALINELQLEAANTRKMLAQVPAGHFDWKPHEKSMSLKKTGDARGRACGLGRSCGEPG